MIEFKLKDALATRGKTMADVNKNTGISKNALSQLANGSTKGIQFNTLDKILEYLKIPIQNLIVFTSAEELKDLSVSIENTEIVFVTDFPEKNFNEIFAATSENDEGATAEKDTGIGYDNNIRIEQLVTIKIKQEEFLVQFPLSVTWSIDFINDNEEIISNYNKLLKEKNTRFKGTDKRLLHFYDIDEIICRYPRGVIFIDDFKKSFDKIQLSSNQKAFISNEIYNNLFDINSNEDVMNTLKKYDIDVSLLTDDNRFLLHSLF